MHVIACPACLKTEDNFMELADHFVEKAKASDPDHVMWINRYISSRVISSRELAILLEEFFASRTVREWIVVHMKDKFLGDQPHPFIRDMQHPTRYTILGYVFEHHHFLRQWAKSCFQIAANTGQEDVQRYEMENLISEFYGSKDRASHHELLLRTGESYGIPRSVVLKSVPLPQTATAIRFWDTVCRNRTFVEGMAAMHTLELIANRNMRRYGASYPYFDETILADGSITNEAVDFLREGYEADVSHSEVALALIEEYSGRLDLDQPCKAVALKSMDIFYDYLLARKQRGEMIENKQ